MNISVSYNLICSVLMLVVDQQSIETFSYWKKRTCCMHRVNVTGKEMNSVLVQVHNLVCFIILTIMAFLELTTSGRCEHSMIKKGSEKNHCSSSKNEALTTPTLSLFTLYFTPLFHFTIFQFEN